MKGTTLLQRQHRRIEQMIDALDAERYLRGALLQELADDLAATMTMEEAIFYPAVREVLGGVVCYGDESHAQATRILQRIFAVERDDVAFRRELAELREHLHGHFEEEGQRVFPIVEQAFSPEELERLGQQMRQLHRAIVESDGEPTSSSIGRLSRADWYHFEMEASARETR